MDIDAIHDLLAEFGIPAGDAPYLVVSRSRPPPASRRIVDLLWLEDVTSSSDLGDLDRHPLAIVFDQLEHMGKRQATHLLAQLRDLYAERVVVLDERQVFTAAELVALGFTRPEGPQDGRRVFMHDPDKFFEPREWNNSRNWANPENFKKYRW